ncbi:carbohydrate ABC transporter permease [Paenibacillus sp. GCM10027626]|uniref:carbohydrate ABC transporter permease n=1 Tax=Paenibacillus sp. GCM10027626 TaxID=3273411 RepID=UPI0036292815
MMGSIRASRWLSTVGQYAMMSCLAVVFLFPLVWMAGKSLMGLNDLYSIPPKLFPGQLHFEAYWQIWSIRPFHLYLKNTLLVVVLSVVGATFSSAFCAFGFARLRFPFKNTIFGVVLSTIMLPGAVTMIPLYVLFSKLGWVNTIFPLVIPLFFGGGAFNIFLLRQFFATIPKDFDEAARIDGAGSWSIFWRLALPLCYPALTVVAVYSFMGAWNDFMGPMIYLSKQESFTLALGLYGLSPGGVGVANIVNTAQLMAACTIAVIPVILVFLLAQRKLISGTVISSGLKG